MGSPVLKTFPHSCEGMFFALSSSKTTSGSCRQRKYSIGRNKNLCARRSSFPGSWLLPKTLRTKILQCFFSAGSKIPFSQLFHHSCNRISLCLFLREIIFKHKYTQMTYTWKQLLWSLKLISLGTSCVSICYNISCVVQVYWPLRYMQLPFNLPLFSVLILAACQKRLFTYMYHMNQNLWKSTSDGIIFFQRCWCTFENLHHWLLCN